MKEAYKVSKGKRSHLAQRKWEDKGQPCERKHHKSYSTPLLEATSNGIVEIFDVIIEKHPQAIEYISDDDENVLHVGIGHRRRDIFRRVKKMEVIMK